MKYARIFMVLFLVAAMACMGCMKSGTGKTKRKPKPKAEDPFAGTTFPDPAKTELTWTKAAELVEGKGWTKTTSADGKDYPGEKVYEATSGSYKLRLKLMKKNKDTSDNLELAKFEMMGPVIDLKTVDQIEPKIKEVLDGLNPGFMKALGQAMSGYRQISQPGHPRNMGVATAKNSWKCTVVTYIGDPDKGVAAVISVTRPFDPMNP